MVVDDTCSSLREEINLIKGKLSGLPSAQDDREVRSRLVELKVKVDSMEEDHNRLRRKAEKIGNYLVKIQGKSSRNEDRLDSLKEQLDALEDRLNTWEAEQRVLDQNQSRKVQSLSIKSSFLYVALGMFATGFLIPLALEIIKSLFQ